MPTLEELTDRIRGAAASENGLDASGLVDEKLTALLNRRVAFLNGCEF